MFSIDNDAFENHLNRYFARFGVDVTLQEIIIPFQDKIKCLSRENNFNEVLIALNAIKRKIIYCIESAVANIKFDKTALLFLPENEHDDLILLYICYVLKMRGYKTLYLGSNIPEQNIIIILKQRKHDHLFTYVKKGDNLNMPALLSYIQEEHPEQKINVVCGNPMDLDITKNAAVVNFIHYLHFNDNLQYA